MKLLILAVLLVVGTSTLLTQSTFACGRCWNITVGENLSALFIDRTGADAGYAIEAMCSVLNKPDPPGSTLLLSCLENNQGDNVRYTN